MTSRRTLIVRLLVGLFVAIGIPIASAAQVPDSFAPNANSSVFAVAVQPDGKVLIGGDFTMLNCDPNCSGASVPRSRIARLNADGSIDNTFNPGAGFRVVAIVVQGDGKIVIGGSFLTVGGGTGTATPRKYLARFNPDGSLDAAFDPGINMTGPVYSLALQADGKILVGGGFYAGLAGGTRYYFGRLNADGTLDTGFSPGMNGAVHSIAVQPDGKILLGGLFTLVGTLNVWDVDRRYIARLNSDGTIDAFNPGANQRVDTILVQGDGKILVGGSFSGLGGGTGTTARNKLGRINADGTVDMAFNPGPPGPNDLVVALAEQTDGKILVGGVFTTLAGAPRSRVGRLNADGSIDGTFDPGAENEVYGFAIQKDGKVLLGGSFEWLGVGAIPRNYVGRLSNTSAPAESLSVGGGGTTLTWSRSGTSPQVWRVEFAYSTNGSTYTHLGAGTRVAGGWQLTGLNLQVHPNLTIRARGYHATGNQGASSSIDELVVAAANFDVIENGSFGNGTTAWSLFATPDMSHIVSNTNGSTFQFYKNPPPSGSNQAVAFQQTGVGFPTNAPITATFQLGNSSSVRKRVSVLVHDADFSDLSVCTFWIPANSPLTPYTMTTHTTKTWANLTISFYAASVGSNGGFYLLDNVTVQFTPGGSTVETWCDDPIAPGPPGGADGPEMLQNGDFGSGAVAPGWGLFGNINGAVTGGVFQFNKTTTAAPAGVLLQLTGQNVPANTILTATFQLGNSSGVRKRVTVILHDETFGDLSACTFWIPPGQALSTYTYRTFATQAWANATLSFYPATLGPEQWTRLDNVSLKRTPSAVIVGTQCFEPGSSPDVLTTSSRAAGPVTLGPTGAAAPAERGGPGEGAGTSDAEATVVDGAEWIADGFVASGELAPSGDASWIARGSAGTASLELARAFEVGAESNATLTFDSRLSLPDGRAEVQVSLDGTTWETIHLATESAAWSPVDVSLDAYRGRTIRLRFVVWLESDGSWEIGDIRLGR